MPCGSICPASDALCIAGFKQASPCQPPTRQICCIGPGIVDSVEQDLYIVFTYKYRHIFFLRDVAPTFPTTPPGPQFLRKSWPQFPEHGLEIEPRFPAKSIRRKSVPNLGRAWGESNLRPFRCKPVRLQLGQVRVASTAIHLHLLHGHHPRPPARPKPKSKIQTPNRPFGFWILEFGFWILDFGFWISLVFVLFVAAPNGPVWI